MINSKYLNYSFYWYKKINHYELDFGPEFSIYKNKNIELIDKAKVYCNYDNDKFTWWIRTIISINF